MKEHPPKERQVGEGWGCGVACDAGRCADGDDVCEICES